MEKQTVIELRGITKRFGTKVVANKNVSMDVKKGEILSVLGENGCGKTTLMNMLAGIYYPDEGTILINGEKVSIRSPKDAFKYKIGMTFSRNHSEIMNGYSLVNRLDNFFNFPSVRADNRIIGNNGIVMNYEIYVIVIQKILFYIINNIVSN